MMRDTRVRRTCRSRFHVALAGGVLVATLALLAAWQIAVLTPSSLRAETISGEVDQALATEVPKRALGRPLFTMNRDGTHMLLGGQDPSRNNMEADWSPDGRQIIISSEAVKGKTGKIENP